ncbi:hypothetical protein NGI48_21415 [Escherichia coli]|nr:hypothetical protein [Escherichia coli]
MYHTIAANALAKSAIYSVAVHSFSPGAGQPGEYLFQVFAPCSSEYRHKQMGGYALLALSSGTAEGRLEGFGHLPQRVFLIGVQAEYHHRAQPYMRRCALFALFRLKVITMIKYD